MGESEILAKLYQELRLDLWWRDLLGQDAVYDGFDAAKAMDSLPRTEVKASEEIGRKFKDRLSYAAATKEWYLWDGRIHTPCEDDGIAQKVAKLYYNAMCDALQFIQDVIRKQASKIEASGITGAADEAKKHLAMYEKGEFVKHRAFRDHMSSSAGISNTIKLLKLVCDVPTSYYDNDQQWFVMRNCVLDLDALRASAAHGDLRRLDFTPLPHDPSRPVTKYFDADLDPRTNLGHWDSFLERSIPDKSSRDYLQEVVGGAMMGTAKMKIIANLYGPPNSGKSVVINTLFTLGREGAGYACMPDSKAIVKVSGQNFEQDHFRGRRIIGISEPSSTEKVDDDFLKRYTGDVWVQTRTLNEESTGWVPQGVVFVASNTVLKINTREKAIVERVQIIEFPTQFETDPDVPGVPDHLRAVPNLENLLLDDRNRILMWILEGMRTFVSKGMKLNPPESVKAKRDQVVTDASTALRWVEEFVEDELIRIDFTVEPQYLVSIPDAYTKYVYWCAVAGEKRPLNRRFFTQDIEKKYNPTGEKIKHDGKLRFPGLAITQEWQMRWGVGPKENLDQSY